ncbi:hypothetical protein NL108_018512 [Boleophthalmus pectinirostris]|nr:hypothetical protein NL108_018512 [Boleophthalmus pectinirostris]
MYDGCSEEMAEKVENENFPKEMNNNALFKRTWENEEKTANKKYKENSKILTQKQIKALIIYTGDDVHEEFNTAVQDSADKYGTDEFKYHTLYYLLTTAIQKLNSAKTCHTTYRRSYDEFTGTLNQEIRFGQFASASFHPNMEDFGTETCFQIETCLGAPIKDYSINRSEDEVLIPPYEKFKIMKIVEGTNYEKLKNCKKIFVVKNTGSQSKLNCRAAPPKQGSSGAL